MNVTAGAPELTIESVVQPSGVYVVQNGTPTLPSTVRLNISDGSYRIVSVTWDSYSTANVGTFNIAGSYNLPSGVTGSKPVVSIQLMVMSAGAEVVDLMPIMVGRTDLFTTGSDGTGNYVSPIEPSLDWDMFNSKLSDIVPGISKIYARYA